MPYADVNGLHLYYEEHGEGPALVLIHGGLMTIELSFRILLPALAEHRRVIAVELQGHGRTADVDRPPTFPDFAADVVALLDFLSIELADVVGFSLGGLTGYELVISHGDRVRRAVLASADHRNDRAGEADPARLPTQDDYQAMRDAYLAAAPDPVAFDAVAEKTVRLVHSFTGWTDDQLRGVQLPVLIVIGDTDIIRVENAARPCGSCRRASSPSCPAPPIWMSLATLCWRPSSRHSSPDTRRRHGHSADDWAAVKCPAEISTSRSAGYQPAAETH